MNNNMIKKSSIIFMCILTWSCSNNDNDQKEEQLLKAQQPAQEVHINRAVFDEMIHSLPQPIEIANIITQANMPFSKEMLVPSDNSEKYRDKYFEAMALGAYGVDLGYINMNDKKLYVVEYLEALRNLASALKVEQFFDFQTLYELNNNRYNADSLIRLSTRNFNKIDEFLREQNRGDLSVLMLIGAWTEGIYMFGKLYKKNPNPELLKRIGEQKVVFENISLILDKLSENQHFNKLKQDAEFVKKEYDKIKIEYKYNPPETKELNGELVIVDKTETTVDITSEQAQLIVNSIETFREKYLLINNKNN